MPKPPRDSDHREDTFRVYLNQIIHEWSRTTSILAIVLVPLFFILDCFTMPAELLPRFAVYRSVATIISVVQYLLVCKTSPSRWSPIHGYLVTLILGGVIALMTVDVGGFSSGYYAGLILVIIGVNLLLPWGTFHSAINGLVVILLYVALNLLPGREFALRDLANNLFFLSGTVIISVSINGVRHRLIRREFELRSELQKATAALWGEMEIATKIQTSLLPKVEQLNGYALASIMQPATEIGGDYVDAFETEAGEHWAMIGDVSGHGVESGLIMMMAQTSIFSLVNKTAGYRPTTLVDHVNSVIRKNIKKLDSNRYMTLFALKLGSDFITLAGKHQDLLIHRAAAGRVEVIPVPGTWIGLADDISEYLWDISITMAIGDTLLLFTDGVTEATDRQGSLFGQDRLVELFSNQTGRPLSELVQNIMAAIRNFQSQQADDITLMALQRTK